MVLDLNGFLARHAFFFLNHFCWWHRCLDLMLTEDKEWDLGAIRSIIVIAFISDVNGLDATGGIQLTLISI